MLQETHSTPDDEKNWCKQWRGKLFLSHGTCNSTDILVGFSEGVDYSVNKEVKDNNGRILILDVEIQGKPYLIINLYADNDQARQLVTSAKLKTIKSRIQDVIQETFDLSDPRVKWEFLKYRIRFFVRIYAKEKTAFRRARRSHLEEKVKSLGNAISSDSSAEILRDYSDAKIELEKTYDDITEGIILPSRAQWYEEGEKSTSYFLRFEKSNKSKSHIRKLILDCDSDNEVVDDTIILQELKTFYCNLYSRRSVKTEEQCLTYLESINTPKLLENETLQREGKLTLKECWDALDSMGSNTSPRNERWSY